MQPFNFHGIRGLCASLPARGGVPVREIRDITTTNSDIRRIGGTADILADALDAPDSLDAFDTFDAFDKAKEKAGKVMPFPARAKGI